MSDRTLDSKKMRARLYRKYDGQCARCGSELPEDWHADHIVPHSKGGDTNFYNMQALCPSCNLKKSDSMPMPSNRNQMSLNGNNGSLDFSQFRPGQSEAVQTITESIRSGQQWVSVVLPTRYGKTDVARTSSYQLWRSNSIDAAVLLEPSRPIVEQACKNEEWIETINRYGLDHQKCSVRELRSTSDLENPQPNGEWFLGVTTQLFNRATHLFIEWMESLSNPILLIVDECHQTSDVNRWGESVMEFADADGRLVSMTATANRSEGEAIPGFENKFVKEGEGEQTVTTDLDEEDKLLVEVYNSVRGKNQIIPDHETSFKQAWNEGVLCDISHSTFDVELDPLNSDSSDEYEYLSQLPKTSAKRHLGGIVRERPVVKKGVSRLLSIQDSWKQKEDRVQSIVFCANDREWDNSDHHARMIKREIERQNPSLDVVRATNQTEGEIRKSLEAFRDGQSDVLISKMAAGVGMDFPNAKVLLDLSPVRSFNSWVQRVMRIATITEWTDTAFLITPEDILSVALYEMLVRHEGGSATIEDPHNLFGSTRLQEKTDEYVVEKKDDEDEGYIANDTMDGSFQDNRDNRGDADVYIDVRNLYEVIPEMHNHVSEAKVAKSLSESGLRIRSDDTGATEQISVNKTEDGDDIKQDIKAIGGWTSKKHREKGCLLSLVIEERYDGDYRMWEKAAKNVWSEMIRKPLDLNTDKWALNDIDNLEDLQAIKKRVKKLRSRLS